MILLNELRQLSEARDPVEIEAAVAAVKKSEEYKELTKLLHDITTSRQAKNGTFEFQKSDPKQDTKWRQPTYVVSAVGRLVHGSSVKHDIGSPAIGANLAENYRRQFQRIIDVLTAEQAGNKKPPVRTYNSDDEEDLSKYLKGENLSIHNSNVKTLRTAPGLVTRLRIEACNGLLSLDGCPEINGDGIIKVTDCKNLMTLKGAPEHVGSILLVNCPNLTTLDGLTSANHVSIDGCRKLKSFEGIGHKYLQRAMTIDLDPTVIKSHVLGLMLIKGLDAIRSVHGNVSTRNPKWYYLAIAALDLPEEDRALEFQHMLIDNDLSEYAQA